MAKNFFYRAVCTDGRGWDAIGAEGVWGADHAEAAQRIFATAAEAWALVVATRNAGCWTVEDDDGGKHEEIPALTVEKCAVYEACWMNPDEDEAEIDAIVDIHGGPIAFVDMPAHIAEFLMAKFSGRGADWRRVSADLVGASSATHTAAFAGAQLSARAQEIADMLSARAA